MQEKISDSELEKELHAFQNDLTNEVGKRKAEQVQKEEIESLKEDYEKPVNKKMKISNNTENANTNVTDDNYNKVPKEIIKYMFTFLNPTDIARMKRVSKSHNDIGKAIERLIPIDDFLHEAKRIIQKMLGNLNQYWEERDNIKRDCQWFDEISNNIKEYANGNSKELDPETLGTIVTENLNVDITNDIADSYENNYNLESWGKSIRALGDDLLQIDSIIKHLVRLAHLRREESFPTPANKN